MKITYDKEANAAYIYFKESQKVLKTVPITKDIIVDFGSRGKILGIEILNASAYISIKSLKDTHLRQLLTA